MSKLSGLSTLFPRRNHGLKPVTNHLGSSYFATTILTTKAEDGTGGVVHIPSSSVMTLSDNSDLTLSTGQSMEIMG